MATTTLLPEPDKFYHIFNRGINGSDLFREHDNYAHFLRLYEKYLSPVADTYAWCLMRNHFHLLLKVREEKEMNPVNNNNRNRVSQAFSNLFNAYTKAVNKRYGRTGSLFEKNFHRIEVSTEPYLRSLVVYIHNNPVHHGFCDYLWDYPWSSYGTIVSLHPTKLQRQGVIGWFDDKANFIEVHKRHPDTKLIEKFIIE
jgi:putative transposase